jgi:hypothetical protein
MAKKRLSRDQKRKVKLAKRAQKEHKASSLAYTGNKYKTDALSDVYLATETAIFESFVMTNRELTDDMVEAALERLVHHLRDADLPPFDLTKTIEVTPGLETDLVIDNIRRNWHQLFEQRQNPGTEQMVGAVRTLLGSIDVWRTPGKSSRGYLRFVEGFVRKAGVSVSRYSEDLEPAEEPRDELLDLGRAWCVDGNEEAAHDFRSLAQSLTRSGEAERVAQVCQQLLGEAADNPRVHPELSALAIQAQERMGPGA